MAVPIFRPEVVRISTEPSPACVECAQCTPASWSGEKPNGICSHPDNVTPEIVDDVWTPAGHCAGFTIRSSKVAGLLA